MVANVDDPTRTLTIRKRWISDFSARYRRLKGDINRFILNSVTVINQPFDFALDPQRVADFLGFLQARIDARIFDGKTTPVDFWQNQYILQAYNRGITIAQIDLKKQGITPQARPISIIGTAFPSLGASTLGLPIHQDAIQLIFTRDFAQLRGITSQMSASIARVLTSGIEQGLGARELAKNINDRVDKVGLTRSKLLARTETVRSYNIATINEGRIVELDTGVEIRQEWITAGDERVRSTHAQRNRKIFEPEVAARLIGEPNCRCSLVPFIEELDDAEDRKERRDQRRKGLALISQTG